MSNPWLWPNPNHGSRTIPKLRVTSLFPNNIPLPVLLPLINAQLIQCLPWEQLPVCNQSSHWVWNWNLFKYSSTYWLQGKKMQGSSEVEESRRVFFLRRKIMFKEHVIWDLTPCIERTHVYLERGTLKAQNGHLFSLLQTKDNYSDPLLSVANFSSPHFARKIAASKSLLQANVTWYVKTSQFHE